MKVGTTPTEALAPLLFPSSVAVVGAGRTGLGRLVLDHLVKSGFQGGLCAVNRARRSIGDVPAVKEISELDVAPDLVVIAVERSAAVDTVRSSAAAGCGAAIVVSAGFAEIGGEGLEAQRVMVDAAAEHGMRLLGPNCMGLINTDPRARLHASFGVGPAIRGPLALVSQSGSVADYVLYHSKRWGLGVSLVASVGNEADVTGDELIRAAVEDDGTRVIACYFEQPARPQELLREIGRAARIKPVVVLMGGRTKKGGDAAASHTGKIVAASRGAAIRSLVRAHGAAVVETLADMMAACTALARHPDGCGNRVCVITNAGGPGVLAVDELSDDGWELSEGNAFADDNSSALPPMASTRGPIVDLTASARGEHFTAASEAMSGRADALLCLVMSPEGTDPEPAVDALTSSWSAPLSIVLLARGDAIDRAVGLTAERGVPVAREPRIAVASLTAVRDRRRALERFRKKSGSSPAIDDSALELVEDAAKRGESALSLVEGFELCRALGIPVPPFAEAATVDEARHAARDIGFPLMVKIDARGAVHKTEVGAVRGPLPDVETLVEAATELLSCGLCRDDADARLVIQRYCEGVELILGVTKHGPWGPVSVVGMGGVATEVADDVEYLPATACIDDVVEALRLMKMGPLLKSFRGQAPVDLELVASTVTKLTALASQSQIIYEIEANPFMAVRGSRGPGGVADIKVLLRKAVSKWKIGAEVDDERRYLV